MSHTGRLTFLLSLAIAMLLLGAVLWRQRSHETLLPVSVGAEAPAHTRAIPPGLQTGEPVRPVPQVSGFQFQVSPSSPPSAADEEALLRLLDDAKRTADATTRRERLTAICVRWAAFNPPAAIALALESGLDPLEGALVPNLAQQWAARDFSAAQTWAARIAPGELRDEVYSRLAYEKALTAPAAAARLLVQMRPTGALREEATLTVVHAWAQRDLAAAVSWVDTLATGPLRERAIAELATTTH